MNNVPTDQNQLNNKSSNDKTKSLYELRQEINKLEVELTENKRKEMIIAQERAELKSMYKWKAPERPYHPKNVQWYTKAGAFSLVLIILAVLTDAILLAVAIVAILALIYAFNTIPPMIFEHEITNKGIKIAGKMYLWRSIPKFWITQRSEDIFINFEVIGEQVPRIIILAGDANINIIAKELVKYIDYLTPAEANRDILSIFSEGKHKEVSEFYQDTTPIKVTPTKIQTLKK